MRILVTGGAGYLGSVLVPTLLASPWVERLTVLDDFRYGQHLALAAHAHDPRLEVVVADVCGGIAPTLLASHDAIVPLAAMVGAPLCARHEHRSWETNFKAIDLLIDRLSRDQLVVYPNTNSGYGAAGEGACTEDTPMSPISWYGRWKLRTEQELLRRHNATVVLRLATVYGMSPRMRLDLLVNDFVRRALVDRSLVLFESHHRRSVVHVRDVARAFTHVLGAYASATSSVRWGTLTSHGRELVFNVASDNVTKRELADLIAERTPLTVLEAPLAEDPDKRDYAVSSARLLATAFRFNHTLPDGIAELLRGLRHLPTTVHGNV